jgi:hypothetical protein
MPIRRRRGWVRPFLFYGDPAVTGSAIALLMPSRTILQYAPTGGGDYEIYPQGNHGRHRLGHLGYDRCAKYQRPNQRQRSASALRATGALGTIDAALIGGAQSSVDIAAQTLGVSFLAHGSGASAPST